jgi:hypothetical protein
LFESEGIHWVPKKGIQTYSTVGNHLNLSNSHYSSKVGGHHMGMVLFPLACVEIGRGSKEIDEIGVAGAHLEGLCPEQLTEDYVGGITSVVEELA